MKLRETFGLLGLSIEQTQMKLDRIVRRKTREVRKHLFKKLDNLINDKKQAICGEKGEGNERSRKIDEVRYRQENYIQQ